MDAINADNSPLDFPCDYPIKAMVRAGTQAHDQVFSIVERHVRFDREEDVRVRDSRNGRFQSLTLAVRVTSRDQLERIYSDLRALDAVLMML